MFELQDYFASKECGKNFEADAIKYTFKTMQLLGYDVKLYKKSKKGSNTMVEVDLSKVYVRPGKEVKKEIKRNKKHRGDNEVSSDEEDNENPPNDKKADVVEAKGP